MENSALATHITVIHSAAKPAQAVGTASAASTPGDAATEFSDVLNAQKRMQAATNEIAQLPSEAANAAATPGSIGSKKALALTEDEKPATPAAESDTALFLPVLTPVTPSELKASAKTAAASPTQDSGTALGVLKSVSEQGSQAAITAKDAVQPAKLASSEKSGTQTADLLPKLDLPSNNTPFALQMAGVHTPKANSALPLAAPSVISVPVGQTGWDQAFSQRVTWIATHDQQSARIELNPPNLGPLEVRISLQHDQASAVFSSPHGAVREAIEAALPKLREMLAESGLTMGSVNVSAQFSQQQQQQQAHSNSSPERQGHFHVNVPTELGPSASPRSLIEERRGLVDIFA